MNVTVVAHAGKRPAAMMICLPRETPQQRTP